MEAARKWYDEQQNGLGKRFVADVRSSIFEIKTKSFYRFCKVYGNKDYFLF
jgi:hypothetical protein